MPDEFSVKIDLGKVPSLMAALVQMRGMKQGMREGAVYFMGKADNYPPRKTLTRKSVYGATFFSDVMQRGFFAKLNSGEIDVPYQRRGSGGLAGKFGIQESDGGLTQTIGNNAPYAPLVIGEQRTKFMEALGWRTMREVYQAEEQAIQRIILSAMQRDIDRI